MFILRRIIKSCNEFPEKPAPCRERNVWTDSPETPQTRLAERGQPMSRWYPCRISCKPSQGPPMRGTCPPQRPDRGIEFELGRAGASSGIAGRRIPCRPGKALRQRSAFHRGGERNVFILLFLIQFSVFSRTLLSHTELKSSDSCQKLSETMLMHVTTTNHSI